MKSESKKNGAPKKAKEAVKREPKNETRYRHIFAGLTGSVKYSDEYGKVKYLSDRVLTIAYRLGRSEKKIHYGIALCAPRTRTESFLNIPKGDNYLKSQGRSIAEARMGKKPYKVEVAEGQSHIFTVMSAILSNKEIPSSARKMIAKYLKQHKANWFQEDIAAYKKIADSIALPTQHHAQTHVVKSLSLDEAISEVAAKWTHEVKAAGFEIVEDGQRPLSPK